jgi:hypothetical protein
LPILNQNKEWNQMFSWMRARFGQNDASTQISPTQIDFANALEADQISIENLTALMQRDPALRTPDRATEACGRVNSLLGCWINGIGTTPTAADYPLTEQGKNAPLDAFITVLKSAGVPEQKCTELQTNWNTAQGMLVRESMTPTRKEPVPPARAPAPYPALAQIF